MIVHGFTIRGGNANGGGFDNFGGGIRLGGDGSLVVANCIIRDNEAVRGGGFSGNGIQTNLFGLQFVGNRAGSASAIDLQGSGGLTLIDFCTLAGNIATASLSDAVIILNGPRGRMHACIVWGNSGVTGIDSQVLRSNAPMFTFGDCCLQNESPVIGPGCFDTDPLFVSLLGPDGITGSGDEDVRPGVGSSCIDRTFSTLLLEDFLDFDNDGNSTEPWPYDLAWAPRIRDILSVPNPTGAIVDVGAYEFQPAPCPGDIDGNGVVNTIDLTAFLAAFGTSGPPGVPGDINNDGTVNTADLVLMLSNFGAVCP